MIISSSLSAKEFLEFGEKDFQSKIKKNNWLVDVSAQYTQYEANFPEYSGEHIKIKDTDIYEMFGVNVGIGKELYFFDDFALSLKTSLFYGENKTEEKGTAAKDIDIDLSEDNTDYRMFGALASLNLNYLIEASWFNIQPFVGTGLGVGIGELERKYTFNGISTASPAISAETYEASLREEFTFINSTVGVSFISKEGLISSIKLTRMDTIKSKRTTEGSIDGTKFKTKEDDLDEQVTNYMASIGMGFYF